MDYELHSPKEVRMFYRFRISIALALLLSAVLAIPAIAGGWAVITLDTLPTGVVAGEPFNIGFTVLQHGRTPMSGLDPTITATLSKSESFIVHAKPEGETGHYAATLTFPTKGNWNWSIQAFSMEQAMPVLSVAPPIAAPVSQQPVAETAPISAVWIVRVLALVIGLAGVVVAYQRKSRLAVGLTAVCLLVGIGSFVNGSSVPESVEAQSKSSAEVVSAPSISQVELGRQLFLAKGCITCHYNSKAARGSEYWTIDNGAPNLSKFSGSPEALRLRLKDPASVKSDTQMPNLNLAEDEIEALIAFINSK
jgi:mono/diheme cytochrome c family protein